MTTQPPSTINNPPPSPIPGDVIPPIVKDRFKARGSGRNRIWLMSHAGSTEGYKELGFFTASIQQKLERSAHYQVPVIPDDVTHLHYTDAVHIIDFTATEIRASLSSNPQPSTENN